MDPSELLTRALRAAPDSAERILYATAGFSALVDGVIVLVGGGAQVTHTGIGRLTDIDVTGALTEADVERILGAGFTREGRHWVLDHDGAAIAIEVPATAFTGLEPPELIDVEGTRIAVISVNDLMMDRLVQATDGTPVTHEEALQLAVAAHDRIDWESLRHRAEGVVASEPFLRDLPALVERYQTAGSDLSD